MLSIIKYPLPEEYSGFLVRPELDNAELEQKVSEILLEIKQNGDKALINYTEMFDRVNLSSLRIETPEIESASHLISAELQTAIKQAYQNISLFHTSQKEEEKIIETQPGIKCWRKSVPIEKVGLYIPGGSAPLFSTVLMLGIPAKLAGCKEIILCTPSDKNGKVNPAILYAANLVGVTHAFRIGGAQAIAAMAFGTESIPKVSKIFGPGNQYVTAAKQMVTKFGIAIDMPAGPSELAILADDSCKPEYVAADLLSQAEHGPDSQVILVSNNEKIIRNINLEIEKQLEKLPRKKTAIQALNNSKAILVKSLSDGIDMINEYAPEHLIIACQNYNILKDQVINAGSVFLGNYSCESAGDYASGTNHTLPTNGYAKAYSGVSLDSFVKKITFQEISQQGIKNIGKTIEVMASSEGLEAHKNAVTIRLK